MESLAAIFKDLYTNFLLRDFAGKIVPGSFFFLSLAVMFVSPVAVCKTISGRVSLLSIALCGGLAWTVVLGLQSVAEYVSAWHYFPTTAGSEMDVQTQIIEPFLRVACPDERMQYERYVVIKEATGNLFNVGLLAAPALALWFLNGLRDPAVRHSVWGSALLKARSLLVAGYAAVVMLGLHGMNVAHVDKQFKLAKGTLDFIASENGAHRCAGTPTSSEEQKQSRGPRA
jgi:hypothetical protein